MNGFSFRSRPIALQWAATILLTALIAAALTALRLPAALLLGAIAGAATVAALEGRPRISPRAFVLAQAILGGMIAQNIKPAILQEIATNWPLFTAAALSVIVASALLGWALTRWRVFPGSTAIWGSLPGAASAMVLMADAYGADARLVAFMQFSRVLAVALVASLVARFFAPGGGAAPDALGAWLGPLDWPAFAWTCLVLGICAWIARRLRIPAGPLLLPMIVGAVLQDAGLMRLELPHAILALAYAAIGWSVGLRFTRDILFHAFKALPAVIGSILALIAICGGFAFLLARFAHIDPMTAYLAMSPGGADSVAIIAASTRLDMPFVMALQMARVLLVILIGPALARWLARRSRPASEAGGERIAGRERIAGPEKIADLEKID